MFRRALRPPDVVFREAGLRCAVADCRWCLPSRLAGRAQAAQRLFPDAGLMTLHAAKGLEFPVVCDDGRAEKRTTTGFDGAFGRGGTRDAGLGPRPAAGGRV